MITTILYPEYFKESDPKDIERELIGLVLGQAKRDFLRSHYGINVKLRTAIITGNVRCIIEKVRTNIYHPPSKPGWTSLSRVKWGQHKTRIVEVKWLPMIDYPHEIHSDNG